MRAVQAVTLLTAALARPSDAFLPSAKLRLRSSQLLHVRSLRGGSTILAQPRKLHVCPGRYGIVVGSRVRGRSRDARPGVSSLLM